MKDITCSDELGRFIGILSNLKTEDNDQSGQLMRERGREENK